MLSGYLNFMNNTSQIKIFLEKVISETNITYNKLAIDSNIPYTTLLGIKNNKHANISLSNLLKIANYTNSLIDEILGKNILIQPNLEIKYKHLETSDVIRNIKFFLKNLIENREVNLYTLSLKLKLGNNTLYNLYHQQHSSINIKTIIAIADEYNLSVDKLIGRI